MQLHEKQRQVIRSRARFKVIRAGRRGGKTALEVEDMSFEALSKMDSPIFYIAPTQIQARAIIWESLKSRLAGIGEINESRLEMRVPTVDGGFSTISVAGWENRENFRGRKARKIYFDEVDTMRGFFLGWQEIFRPALTDLKGEAMFSGTPKKENPNLRRLEKIAESDSDYEAFHFTTYDNPHVPKEEIEKARKELDGDSFRQEYLAEYIENQGSLFSYSALVDCFTNTVPKDGNKYLTVDVADDGSDKTVFSFWDGMEEYRREEFSGMNSESLIAQIRDYASLERIPYSHIAVDAIGVGSAAASSSLLNGIIGFKGSYAPIKTDLDIVRNPGTGYLPGAPILTSDYRNLRVQCVFELSRLVNEHKMASRVTGSFRERTIEEVSVYQDTSTGDGKRMCTTSEEVKEAIGRSPDHASTWIMRMYFHVMSRMTPNQSDESSEVARRLRNQLLANRANISSSGTR